MACILKLHRKSQSSYKVKVKEIKGLENLAQKHISLGELRAALQCYSNAVELLDNVINHDCPENKITALKKKICN